MNTRYRATMFIMKRGNVELEVILKGCKLAWIKQLCTDIALYLPRKIESEAILNVTAVNWDMQVLSGGAHTTIRMPWYIGGKRKDKND